MIKFLKSRWISILVVCSIVGYATYSLIVSIQDFTTAKLEEAGVKTFLFAIMMCLIAWLAEYFKTHRKVKNKDV